jgi:hypothetical protein
VAESDDLQQHGSRLAAGGWKWVGSSGDGQAIVLGGFLRGVNPWAYKWQYTGARVELEDPAYHERYSVPVIRVDADGRHVYFAATELSAGVFGFWRPTC